MSFLERGVGVHNREGGKWLYCIFILAYCCVGSPYRIVGIVVTKGSEE